MSQTNFKPMSHMFSEIYLVQNAFLIADSRVHLMVANPSTAMNY